MNESAAKCSHAQSLYNGFVVSTLVMVLLWLLETIGVLLRGSVSGEGFQSPLAFPSGPTIAFLLYLGAGALPGTLYYGLRWRSLWSSRADKWYTVFWVAGGLHLFLRFSTIHRFHPGFSVHTIFYSLLPPAVLFLITGEAARAMALLGKRLSVTRHGETAQRTLLFIVHAILFLGMTVTLTLGCSRASAAGLLLFLGSSMVVGLLAFVGVWGDKRWRSPVIWTVLALGLVTAQLGLEGFAGWKERQGRRTSPVSALLGDPRGIPIIQVTIDTLRADRLSSFGGPEDTSPMLSSMENAGMVRFADCTSQAPWTAPSTSSMFTGLHPCRLGTLAGPLEDSDVTLAERLLDAGYRTGAFSDNDMISPNLGFHQGFSEFHTFGKRGRVSHYCLIRSNRNLPSLLERYFHQRYEGVDKLLPSVLSWLDRHRNQTFYLYLHLMDPHAPYYDHPGFRPAERTDGMDRPVTIIAPALYAQKESTGVVVVSAEQRRELLTRYDAEIRRTDLALGRLFEHLKALGLWDNCLLIVSSDHGEEFFEHGSFGHIHSVHRELLHVPLWIKPPASTPARVNVVSRPVQLLDLVPTILDYAGLPVSTVFPGRSLRPLIHAVQDRTWEDERIITAGTIYLYPRQKCCLSARQGNLKCIRVRTENRESDTWYDLEADPTEQQPLSPVPRSESARAILDALHRLEQTLEENTFKIDRDLKARLQAMGYMN